MTQETMADLSRNIRIGFTSQRPRGAWWWQGDEDGTHFENAIPTEEADKLLGWHPLVGDVSVTTLTEDGVTTIPDDKRKAMVHPTKGHIISIVGKNYEPHPYRETLIDLTKQIVDDGDLGIGSLGTLKRDAWAFVQFELGDTLVAAEGIEFRPFLTAATSLDGSLATQFFRGNQVVVCDNTLQIAMRSAADKFKVRHTRNSGVRLQDAREVLGIVHQTADAFMQEVATLTQEYVSDSRFREFVEAWAPMPKDAGRGQTIADEKRWQLAKLWQDDPRVAPWRNSAYGVLAATNTWANHMAQVKGDRVERQKGKLIDGTFARSDAATLQVLAGVR